ncbi:hypothetical protein RUM43_014615 [Polyplax serrata]|uniref:Uncharacterized protein n=1 Tax=Polyplax serrata TaxID=468196 RepID=A0AAN8P4A7_POLSC
MQEEITGIYLPPTPSPPPAYETVMKIRDKENGQILTKEPAGYSPNATKILPEDDDLPPYEVAIKLKSDGYM